MSLIERAEPGTDVRSAMAHNIRMQVYGFMVTLQSLLPFDIGLSRKALLRRWLKANKRRLKDYAVAMGVHPSAPGKWLIAESEPVPEARRAQFVALGIPADLIP